MRAWCLVFCLSLGLGLTAACSSSGTDADGGGIILPDAFVELTVGSVQGKTTTKNNTYTPYWNELVLTTTADAITKYGLGVKVYDEDWPGKELMANCSLGVSESVLISGAGQSTKCTLSGTLHVTKILFKFTSN